MEGSLVAYKVFTNGSVLNASEINDNLMNQAVMVFSNSTARAAALTAPTEGMLTWLEDVNRYEYRNGSGAWVTLGNTGILQVVSTTKTDTFTTTSTTFTDITGFSATITPSSTNSKIYIVASMLTGQNVQVTSSHFLLLRGSTSISIGDAASARTRVTSASYASSANETVPVALSFLDSPATTSAVTYKIQIRSSVSGGGNASYVNRSNGDVDNASAARGASTITLMEVAG